MRGVGRENCGERVRCASRSLPAFPTKAQVSAHQNTTCTHHRQVFGLMGNSAVSGLFPTDHRFPSCFICSPVLDGDFRSQLPLRGSPGFSPGSLLVQKASCPVDIDSVDPTTSRKTNRQASCLSTESPLAINRERGYASRRLGWPCSRALEGSR